MFNDEKPTDPIVGDDDFKLLAKNFLDNRGKPWTDAEALGVYEHLETLLFNVTLFHMALDGFITITHNGREIMYQATETGDDLAERHMKNKDKTIVDDLLRGIE